MNNFNIIFIRLGNHKISQQCTVISGEWSGRAGHNRKNKDYE